MKRVLTPASEVFSRSKGKAARLQMGSGPSYSCRSSQAGSEHDEGGKEGDTEKGPCQIGVPKIL